MSAARRPEVIVGALALLLALVVLLLDPAGTDLAAQTARASFARDAPLTPVDLSWFSGSYPFGYSALAPGLMALLGVALTGLVATVAAPVLLTRLLRSAPRPLLGGMVTAVCSAANLASGRTTFAVGAVAALGCLLLLHRVRWALALAVLTALLSPVAAAFLGFAAAVLVLRRQRIGWAIGVACAVPVAALALAFPTDGVQPFTAGPARTMVILALLVAILTSSSTLRLAALLYAPLVIAFAAHDDPFGSNVTRLGLVLAATLIVSTSKAPLPLVLAAALFCLYHQLQPAWKDLHTDPGPSSTALVTQLESRSAARVEVLATRDHREAADVAEHVPLARGWLRQVDFGANQLFYSGTLEAADYLAWLHEHAVDHVAVPRRSDLDFGSSREAALLSAPVPGLTEIWSDRSWRLLAVDDPTPIASAPASVVRSERTALVLRSPVAVEVAVDVRWSRWLALSGPGCLTHDGDQTRVRFSGPGEVRLSSSLRPHGHC